MLKGKYSPTPGTVSDLTAAAASGSQLQLAFTAPANAVSYEYRLNQGGSAITLAGDLIVDGLDASTQYDVEVRGVKYNRQGAWSNVATATTSAGSGAPAIANQTIEFGRKTRSGAGGGELVTTGGAVETITLGTRTVGSDHFIVSVTEPHTIVPNLNGPTDATYTWTGCTATNSVGTSPTFTLTITTIANAWSVRTAAQLTTAGQHTSLALGDQILLRSGTYNATQINTQGISRSTAPSGVWSAPTLYDAAQPDRGYDLDTGNFVVITPHTGASPVIARFRLNGANGGVKYFRFTGLTFTNPTLAATSSAVREFGALAIDNCQYNAVDNCTFTSNADIEDAADGNVASGITMAIGANSGYTYIYDNVFHDVWTAISGAAIGNHYVGNDIYRFFGDGVTFKPADDILFSWNKVYHIQVPDIAGHQDFLQWNDSANTADVDNMRIIGNRMWAGDVRDGGAAAGLTGQGYFGDDLDPPYFYTNTVFAGNMGVFAQVNPFAVARWQGAKVYNNTIVMDDAYGSNKSFQFGATAADRGCDACLVGYNVYHGFAETNTIGAHTLTDNITADVTAGSGATSYAALFDNPQSLENITDPAVNFAIKAGSAAAVLSTKAGAAGTGYVNYTTRETSFPWDV
jgi:hypothetical protein